MSLMHDDSRGSLLFHTTMSFLYFSKDLCANVFELHWESEIHPFFPIITTRLNMPFLGSFSQIAADAFLYLQFLFGMKI